MPLDHRGRRRRAGGHHLDRPSSERLGRAALSSMFMTTGAPHRWVTPWRSIAS